MLLYIEGSLVNAVLFYLVSELASGKVMKNESVLSGIDNLSVIESFKFLDKSRFICKLLKIP